MVPGQGNPPLGEHHAMSKVERIITLTNVGPAARFFCDGELMIPYREHKRVCDALEEAGKRIEELEAAARREVV